MKSIYEITAKKTMTAPGMWDCEAEAKVTGPDTAEEIFVYASTDGEFKTFKVDSKSILAELSNSATKEYSQEFDDAIWRYAHGELSQEEIEKWGFGKHASNYLEEYEKLSAAKSSKYYEVFKTLNSILNAMWKEVG